MATDIHRHVYTTEYEIICSAMKNMNIICLHKELIARDIPDEFKRYNRKGVLGKRAVILSHKYVDIVDLLEEASKRPTKAHHADDVSCVFFYGFFGKIPKDESSEERWVTFFRNTREDRGCFVCYEKGVKKYICVRCGKYTCGECVKRSIVNQCAYCRRELIR